METNKQGNDYYEDEIDLFELIHLILKNKKILAVLTIGVAVVSFALTAFIIKPQYQAELKFDLDMPGRVATEYGEYETGLTTNQDVANLIHADELYKNIEEKTGYVDLKSAVVNTQDLNKPKELIMKISGTDPEKLEELAKNLTGEYESYLDDKIQGEYLEYYKR